MWSFFGRGRKIEKLEEEVKDSFNNVKKDFDKVGKWIKHLDDKQASRDDEIDRIKNQLLIIQEDIIELKDFISFFGPQLSKSLSKQGQTGVNKQTASEVVQTPVQTAVQTGILENLTVMERAIVWALLNSDMNLSYEDLAAILGKDKSTIRGQINAIKQKNEGLINEALGVGGKKRLYVPEDMKLAILKSVKVKIKKGRKSKK